MQQRWPLTGFLSKCVCVCVELHYGLHNCVVMRRYSHFLAFCQRINEWNLLFGQMLMAFVLDWLPHNNGATKVWATTTHTTVNMYSRLKCWNITHSGGGCWLFACRLLLAAAVCPSPVRCWYRKCSVTYFVDILINLTLAIWD